MKSFLVIILITVLSVITGCTHNPYCGKYLNNGDSSKILKLDTNYDFEIIILMGKNDCYIENGRYSVVDNTITLIFNSDSTKLSDNKTLTGKVTGSEIKITSFTDPFIKE